MDAEGEWPPEDDYDALNDETFGGEADGEGKFLFKGSQMASIHISIQRVGN